MLINMYRKGIEFNNNIYELCVKKNITQNCLANKVGIHRSSMNRIVNGHVMPSVLLAMIISKVLNEPINSIFKYTINTQ